MPNLISFYRTDSFKGDYLLLGRDARVLDVVRYEHGDEGVIFSDHVQKINRRNEYQARVLVVTERVSTYTQTCIISSSQ